MNQRPIEPISNESQTLDKHSNSSRVWKDIDPYLRRLFSSEDTQTQRRQEVPTDTLLRPAKSESPSPKQHQYEVAASSPDPVQSFEVRADVDDIKRKYIVGKLSGKDIFNNEGILIIAQNDVITADTVDLADRSGKLVELIVHMTIQF